jgi:lysine 2,3-aminomutase
MDWPSVPTHQDVMNVIGNHRDWRWQMRQRIRSVAELQQRFPNLRGQVTGVADAAARFAMAIPPYYAALIQRADARDPIFRLAVPQAAELCDPPHLAADPLGEERHTPLPGLLRRYDDRALVLATTTCAMYCRHCDRKRLTGARETALTPAALRRIVAYLRQHPEIRDVILSGGDPLTRSDLALKRLLAAIRAVPSVEIIRLHTRTPVTLPQRITPGLVKMLRRFQPLWINTQFNHPRELTPAACAALARLADAGFPLGNQSVLLRGVNDSAKTLEELFRGLVRNRVRPYYLFQCELVRGVEHFRVPVRRGLKIMEQLRRRLSSLAIPTYVLDTPTAGKIPLSAAAIIRATKQRIVLRSPHGQLVEYPEPLER